MSDRLFDVEELFSAWVYRLKKENLGTCSYEDFVEMCGTPSCFHVCCTQANPYHATPRHATTSTLNVRHPIEPQSLALSVGMKNAKSNKQHTKALPLFPSKGRKQPNIYR